jgi:hypothetical protein
MGRTKHNAIADFELLNPCSSLNHNSSRLSSGRKRQRRFHLILSDELKQIEKIQCGGFDRNPHLFDKSKL